MIIYSIGEFCNNIMRYLYDKGFKVTGFHYELKDSYLTDKNGEIIYYKSGEQGQPKIFKLLVYPLIIFLLIAMIIII